MIKPKVRHISRPTKAKKFVNKLADNLKKEDTLKVGLPKGSNDYPDGTSVIMVGAVHEFGNEEQGVPERSFLRATVFEERPKLKAAMKRIAKKMIKLNIPPEKGLQELGVVLVALVRARISDGIEPELKHREGTPLWDTGHLIRTITYEVLNADKR